MCYISKFWHWFSKTILPKHIPSCGVFMMMMMMVKSAVYNINPKFLDVQLSWDLVTLKNKACAFMVFIFISGSMTERMVVLETTRSRIEMLHYKIKVISLNHFVLICSPFPFPLRGWVNQNHDSITEPPHRV